MSEYDEVIRTAEDEAGNGRFKDAYNTLGRALRIGGPDDRKCRYLRGVYALRVAQSRMERFQDSGESGTLLVKAACWLSRSEAYLSSAGEDAPDDEVARINDLLRVNRAGQQRFRQLADEFGLDLFGSDDELVSER
ncbi:MAG: hypothetical protein ABR540_21460 [Acidimicrobiales bacterium]|nr:hypothetical protein [Actinomycetota bacterium]